uniref:Uncharacterized LOC101733605 n=1 Tax=Xenopus tropicalis TaxID=8364 RepID=A0A6I8RRJ2_XENTR
MSRPKQESPRHIVGLTSRCPAIYPKWLTDLLTTQYSDLVLAVKYLPISSGSSRQWRAEVKACSIVILYHSTKEGRIGPTGTRGTIYDKELLYLAQHLGQEKVMVVLDDMKPISEAEKEKTLKSLNSLQRYCCRLLLIPENRKITALRQKAPEIRNFLVGEHCIKRATSPPSSSRPSKNSRQAHLSGTRPIPKSGRNMAPQSDIRPSFQSREPLHQTYLRPRQTQPPSPTKVHKVGVFSRAAGSHYQWLVNQLKSAFANDVGVTFHSVPISNNYVDFTSGLANCTFAVLYHTLNSGRLSVTDVTDSLYDRELEDLSLHLGRNNVIVVLDDLTDSGPEEKKKILQNQPSINRLARELFLISEKEKGSRGGSNYSASVLESQILKLKLERIVHIINDNTGMAAPKGTNHRHQDSFQTEYQRQFTASQQRADHKASLSPSKSDEGKPTSNGVSSIWETKENIYYDTDSKTELGKSRNKGPTLPRSEEHVKENIGFTGAPTSSRDPQNPSRRSNEDTLGSSPSRTPASHKYDSSASYGKSPKATDHDQQRPLSSLSKKAQQRSESAKNHHKTEAPTSPHSLGQMQSSHLVDLMDNLFQQQHDMILDYYKSQLLIYEKVIKAWHGLRQQINEKDNKLTECQHIIHKQELTICKQENMIRQLMDTHPLYRQNRK